MTIDHLVIEWDGVGRPSRWYDLPHCRKCNSPLPQGSKGEWIAAYPDREIVGYHPTTFCNPHADYQSVVKALQTTNETKRREAYNQLLGEWYTPTGGQMTANILDGLRRDYLHGPTQARGVFAGCDVGNVLHVVIRDREGKQILAAEADSFDEVGCIFHRHNVDVMVIDAMPETHKARELQESLPAQKCWLAYYVDDSKHRDIAQWDEEKGTVTIDRTRAMDDTYTQFYEGVFTLPANARDIKDYYAQLCAPVRVLEEKGGGVPVARYVHSKPDHYAHAETYCNVAMYAPQPGRVVSQIVSAAKLLG